MAKRKKGKKKSCKHPTPIEKLALATAILSLIRELLSFINNLID